MTRFLLGRSAALASIALVAACGPRGSRAESVDTIAATLSAAEIDSVRARADRSRIKGDSTAPLWIVEVSDFQCPYCRMWAQETYPTIGTEFVTPGKVRMAYLNLPMPNHAHAVLAAEAALCAGAQDKFWQYHDSLFASQTRWEKLPSADSTFRDLARSIGLNVREWQGCVTSGAVRPLIAQDVQRIEQTGARSTPTFFIGDTAIVGAQPIDRFRAVIAAQLARSGARR